jgi:hypothetical protein
MSRDKIAFVVRNRKLNGNYLPHHVCPSKEKTFAKYKKQNHFARTFKSNAVFLCVNKSTMTSR